MGIMIRNSHYWQTVTLPIETHYEANSVDGEQDKSARVGEVCRETHVR